MQKIKLKPSRLKWKMRWLIIMVGIAFFIADASAQEESGEDVKGAQVLETMEVWGTQIDSTSVSLGEDKISVKQADHLSDLLRDIPGVDVGGTHSLNQRINIRSLSGTKLDVRLDGAPQDVYLFHHFGDLRINADILKEADIQVGENSIVNNGLGGGVRFKTMSADDLLPEGRKLGARLRAGVATNSADTYSLTGFGRAGIFDIMAYGTYLDQKTAEDGEGNDLPKGDGEVVNLLAKGGVNIGDSQRIELTLDSFTDEGDYPARPNFGQQWADLASADLIFPTEYNRQSASLGYELNLGANLALEATIYHTKNDIERWEGAMNGVRWLAARDDADIEGEGLNQGGTVLARSSFQTAAVSHDLTYGVEYQRQTSEQTVTPRSTSTTAVYVHSEEERLLQTVYLEDRIGYGILALTPGVRYNHYNRQFDGQPEQTWTDWTYALGGEVNITDEFRTRIPDAHGRSFWKHSGRHWESFRPGSAGQPGN